ncbi:unnamed protein product [Closterium sp. NIES-54]
MDFMDHENTLWRSYNAAAPGDFECLEDAIKGFQRQQEHPPRAKVAWETVIEVHKGVAIPPDYDFTRYSKYPSYARATPSFYGAPWFSDVSVDGVDDDGEKMVWPAKLLMIFTLHRTVTTTRRNPTTMLNKWHLSATRGGIPQAIQPR